MTKTLLKTSNATILKRKPIQSIDLPDLEKYAIEAGQTFELHSYFPERDHVRVAFANEFLTGSTPGMCTLRMLKLSRMAKRFYRSHDPNRLN